MRTQLRRGVLATCGVAAAALLTASIVSPAAAAGETQRHRWGGHTYAYVANWDMNSLSVVDTETKQVTASIDVGPRPSGIAALPDGSKLYVSNAGDDGSIGEQVDGDVSVVDTKTNTVTATLRAGQYPYSAISSRFGTRVYVTSSNGADKAGLVTVLDTRTDEVVTTVPVGTAPTYQSLSPDGSRLYVSNFGESSVSIMDTRTNRVLDTVAVPGIGVGGSAVSPFGDKLYVVTYSSNPEGPDTISVINTRSREVTGSIPVSRFPFGIALSPDGRKLYVPAQGGNDVSVVDTRRQKVTATVPIGEGTVPMDAAVSRDGRQVWVAVAVASRVQVIDARTNEITDTIPTDLGSWVIELVNVRR